jgi:ABC-2 type transport system ATP-binding protein
MMEKAPVNFAVETIDISKRFPRKADWKALLRRRRGETVALDEVSIQVRKGEIFGVLGPNGAGKTTLIKVLSTLILPTSGQAFVNGFDTIRQGTNVRKSIGVIYGDERTFFWRLNVVENLRFYAALYRMPRDFAEERIEYLLDMVGLTDATDVRMHHFSSGMKQRAAIARGLLGDPEIVFMDEPTRSLDPLGAFEIRQIIRERLVAGGKHTVLVATNLMAEAEILCDRVALIDRGRLQLMGSVEELRRVISDHKRYVLELSHTQPDDFGSLLQIPGVLEMHSSVSDNDHLSLELTVEGQSDAVPKVIQRLVEAGASIWSCTPSELSLDDIFRISLGGGERNHQAQEIEDIR